MMNRFDIKFKLLICMSLFITLVVKHSIRLRINLGIRILCLEKKGYCQIQLILYKYIGYMHDPSLPIC